MRCVAAPGAGGIPPPTREERSALEAVRHLDTRFPSARLREVPLVRALDLDAQADPSGRTRVWLALEMLQVTGSFKVRGALVSLDARRAHGRVVAAGGGNHALAVAYAARVLDLGATICVPRNTPRERRAKLEKYGAEVVVAMGDSRREAEALARRIADAERAAFVSARDDLDIVRGSGASLGFEIVRALGGVPERVLAPFGGGGLATGLAWALAAEAADAADGEPRRDGNGARGGPGRVERSVWGVQSEGASSVQDPSPRALSSVAGILAVHETCIQAAMVHAYRDMGLILEWRAAAALAPVLLGLPEALRGGDVVVVLTGRNVQRERAPAVHESTDDWRV